jgi:hypothetical protein
MHESNAVYIAYLMPWEWCCHEAGRVPNVDSD